MLLHFMLIGGKMLSKAEATAIKDAIDEMKGSSVALQALIDIVFDLAENVQKLGDAFAIAAKEQQNLRHEFDELVMLQREQNERR